MRATTRPGFGHLLLAELYKATCSLTVWVLMGATVVAVCVCAVGVPGLQTASLFAMLLGCGLWGRSIRVLPHRGCSGGATRGNVLVRG